MFVSPISAFTQERVPIKRKHEFPLSGPGRTQQAEIARSDSPGWGVLGIIAENLKKPGWSLGWVSAVEPHGQTIFVADAPRDERLKLSTARSRNR
jgi:hypothetical protein